MHVQHNKTKWPTENVYGDCKILHIQTLKTL